MTYDKSISEVLEEQYEALTEDLDREAREEPFTQEWVIDRALQNEKLYLSELAEDTIKKADFAVFTTVALPLVRKIFSRLIAMDLVSVQPISQPTAKVFWLDFTWGTTAAGVTKGDSVYDSKPTAYAARTTEGTTPRDLQMKLTSTSVEAIERALKASWSIESQQDLKAYHGLSIESEILAILQEEIVREIDGLILAQLLSCASAGNVNWDCNAPSDDKSTLEKTAYKKTLYEAIVDASNLIYKKRYRYATWIVGHPDAIVRLEKLEEFKITPSGTAGPAADQFTVGRHLIGTLADRYKVYKDPFWPDSTKLLLGYKGATWSDTVGYYAPYIPLYTTPILVDPDDFTPRRGLLSRFAYGCLISDGMATVTLQNAS